MGVFLSLRSRSRTPLRLPHARGGVSGWHRARFWKRSSSPRPWGCFFKQVIAVLFTEVFPTPVGVFPVFRPLSPLSFGLPHARGGVSYRALSLAHPDKSSPRPWGCFQIQLSRIFTRLVFPTPVGVFLIGIDRGMGIESLPHARGGVSDSRQ